MPGANYIADGDISPSRFVKTLTTADNSVAQAGANAAVIGISQEGAREPPLPGVTLLAGKTGDNIQIYQMTDSCLLELGGTIVAGDYLKSDANGKGVVIATTGTTAQEIGARALTAGASGEKVRVQVFIETKVYPALA